MERSVIARQVTVVVDDRRGEGPLYIGERIDAASHEREGTPVVLAASDFTTHGVIVGMTGSGKTGLGLVLVEEALLSGVPVDHRPEGRPHELALTFPRACAHRLPPRGSTKATRRRPERRPTRSPSRKRRGGARDSALGRRSRPHRRAAHTADITIYTPGSTSGVPLNLVGSLQAPNNADAETIADEVGAVSGLLGLVDIDADPLSSREHILRRTSSRRHGRRAETSTSPRSSGRCNSRRCASSASSRSTRSSHRRTAPSLAPGLNGLLASPSFAAWTQGAVRHRPSADLTGREARRRDRDDRAPL